MLIIGKGADLLQVEDRSRWLDLLLALGSATKCLGTKTSRVDYKSLDKGAIFFWVTWASRNLGFSFCFEIPKEYLETC